MKEENTIIMIEIFKKISKENKMLNFKIIISVFCLFFISNLFSELMITEPGKVELLTTIPLKTLMKKVNNWHKEGIFINYDSFFIFDDPPELIWGFSHIKNIRNINNTFSRINDLLICNKDSIMINYHDIENPFCDAQSYLGFIRGFKYDYSSKKISIKQDDCINQGLEIFKTSEIKTEIDNCYDVISFSYISPNIVTYRDYYSEQYFLINKSIEKSTKKYSICYFENYNHMQIFDLADHVNDMIDNGYNIIGFCDNNIVLNDTKEIVIYNFKANKSIIIDLDIFIDQLGLSEYKLPPEYIVPYGLFVNKNGVYMFLHCKETAYIYLMEF